MLSSVNILDLKIPSTIILWIFVGIAGFALLLFILNLAFNKSSSHRAKKNSVDAKGQEKREMFEDQKSNIETEISLIIRTEKSKKENQDESEELKQKD